MNKLMTKIVGACLGLTMAVGVGVAIASNKKAVPVRADVSYTWEKISSSTFGIGDELIFGYSSGTTFKEMTSGTGTATNVSNSTFAETYVLTVEAGNGGTGYSFKNGSNYISWSSGNNLTTSSTKNNASSWTISAYSDGNYKLANVGTTARILQYNASSPKFAPYTSSQTAFNIWKKTPVQSDYVSAVAIKSGESEIEEAELDVASTNTLNLTADVTVVGSPTYTITWVSDDTNVATVSNSTGASTTVTAVGMGTTTITLGAGGKEATLELTVDDSSLTVSTLTFTAACGGTGTSDDGLTWSVESGTGEATTAESTFDNTRGIHYGTGSSSVKYITLTSADGGVDGTVKFIKVHASGNNTPTLSITVGGNAFGSSKTLTTSDAEYLFSGSKSGTIVISNAKDTAATGGLYVKSISVYYVPTVHVSTLTLSPSELSISSNDTEAKTINVAVNPETADDQYLTIAQTSGDSLVTISAANVTAVSGSASFTVTGKEATSGSEVITVTSRDGSKTATLTITAVDASIPMLVGVTVGGTASKTTQYPGYDFDPSGLTFTPVYNKDNPSPESITGNDIVWDDLVAGQAVTGKFTGETATVVVTVPVEKVIVSGTVSSYEAIGTATANMGDASWDLSNVTIKAYYDAEKEYEKVLIKGTDYSLTASTSGDNSIIRSRTSIIVSDSLSKIPGTFTVDALVSGKLNYIEELSINSGSVISGTSYDSHSATVDGIDWIVTYGGNNSSVGTNSSKKANCRVDDKYVAETGIDNENVIAAAFVSGEALGFNVAKVNYKASGLFGTPVVYLIYSADGTSFSQVPLKSGTQGSSISTDANGVDFVLSNPSNGYFGLLLYTNTTSDFKSTLNLTFYAVKTDDDIVDEFVLNYMHMEDDAYDKGSTYVGLCDAEDGEGNTPYSLAKEAFNALDDDQRDLFLKEAKYSNAKARLLAWAEANHDSLNSTTNVLEANRGSFGNLFADNSNSTATIIIIISMISLTTIAGYAILRKRKEQ